MGSISIIKKVFWLAMALVPLSALTGCSKEEEKGACYYYYFNEKIYLDERKDLMFVQFDPGLSAEQKKAILNSDPSLRPWTENGVGGTGMTYDGNNMYFACLQSDIRISQSKLRSLGNREGVRYVSYMYEYHGQVTAIGNRFSVMLKDKNNEAGLAELVKKYNCSYEHSISIPWDGLYMVTLPPKSFIPTIRLSCIFQESGLFQWSSPDFFSFMAFDY